MSSPDNPLTSFIAGRWVAADQALPVERENPGRSAEVAARWCPATVADAGFAMDGAASAIPGWAGTPLKKRLALLSGLLGDIEADAEAFAAIITRENGKPLRDSRAEVTSSLADARHSLAEAARLGDVEPAESPKPGVRSFLQLEPVGPCLLVTPWNFPLATILRKLVPALAWGNPAVVKPSELTPATAVRLFERVASLSLPAGTASLVLGHGGDSGAALAAHPALRAISFTGSNATGASLSRATAGRDVRLQLEMGGKNSLVVLADADTEAAAEAAVVGGFTCSGQWCTGTGRVIVEQPAHDAFIAALLGRVRALRIGPGDADGVDVGPVITAQRVDFARRIVDESVAAGARAHVAAAPPPGGHFVAPAVLEGVTAEMRAFRDELFVPVLPVTRARDADDAIRLANCGTYGLSASVFSRDADRALGLARRVEAGIVHVNLHTAYREPALSVAGWRESGRGPPECGRFARDFFTRPRAVYLRR